MDELTGISTTFPVNELGKPRTPLAERAAEVCAIAERLLYAMGHEWYAYNFEQDSDAGVIFNVRYPKDGLTWVTSGALRFHHVADDELAAELAAWWDREFKGENAPGKVNR